MFSDERSNSSNSNLLLEIKNAHKSSYETYGVRRIHGHLINNGILCSRNRIARIMQKNGIRSRTKKKFIATTDSNHNLPVAQNILNRDFAISEPNKVWVSDITYVRTMQGWLYLAAVIDLFNRKVIGWSMDDRITRDLAINALNMALLRRRPGSGLLHHSDRGVQYASCDYQELLKEHDIICSMSRKGNCWDNAPAESFFSTMKKERVHHRVYRTKEEAKQDIFQYIEVFYNRIRLHSALGYLSPVMFEAKNAA
jgi:putative transposase